MLYKLSHIGMWTKLRPFALEFLARASKQFELYVYTMGERLYALEMASVLDPSGALFPGRVISAGDSTKRTAKDLDVIMGQDSHVMIVDDTAGVWPRHADNLLVAERYHFFPSSLEHFGLQGKALLQCGLDEDAGANCLARLLGVLEKVHQGFFSGAGPEQWQELQDRDVRQELRRMRGQVRRG